MKIAITGALGHIGSRLIRSLPAGVFDEVLLIDNLATQRYGSLFDLPSDIPFSFTEEDVLTADFDLLFGQIDAVIHLAAITDAENSVLIPEKVMSVNVEGTRRVASACVRNHCRMVFISTTSVYGVQEGEVDEECSDHQLLPQSPYAESKLMGERVVQELGEGDGLRFTTCRFGTIFGASPGMRFHTAVNRFVWQAILGLPLTVWSAAIDQRRPYLDLGDAVNAVLFILRRDLFNRQLFNVVTLNATVREIVAAISNFIPDLTVQYVDSRIMNQLSYAVSSRRFKAAGFAFQGQLENGIGDTVKWLAALKRQDRGTR